MGSVFLAEDLQLQRTVALKVMLPETARKATAKERFLREARAVAAIEHENIVSVYQIGEDQGVSYLAMQLLGGTSLQELLERQATGAAAPLKLADVLRIGGETAAGLAAAHERGLIHRDIKPSNLWLDASAAGRVKILDFGLARSSAVCSQLTQGNAIVGSPAFMSPEQARQENVDARADLFSLGCVLYRLCTGQLPWNGQDGMGTLIAIATEHPSPAAELNPRLPPKLARLIMQLLAKSPDKRPASAAAVAAELAGLEQQLPAAVLRMPMPVKQDEAPAAGGWGRFGAVWRGGRNRRLLAVLGALAALTLAAVISVKTDTGTLLIDALDSDVRVTVEQNGKKVEVIDTKTDTRLPLHAGEYRLRLDEQHPNLRLEKDAVQITRGGQVVVSVRWVADPQAADGNHAPVAAGKTSSSPGIVNSLGMKMVAIPAGTFLMGSPAADRWKQADEYQHEVRLTRPFHMSDCDVTVGQFRQFIAASSYMPDGGDAWLSPGFEQTDAYPVGDVTWNDAVAFCEWLSRKESRTYRLPTEAEWEYCCRAGSTTTWFFADNPADLGHYAWFSGNGGRTPHPVGLLKPNAWGLYDMLGEVWQWTGDWYAEDYYRESPRDDPTGPASGTYRVQRGGSLFMDAKYCRSALRHGVHPPSWRRAHVGFRVVWIPEATQSKAE